MLGALVCFAGAVLTLSLVRERDIERTAPEATDGPRPEPQPEAAVA